MGNWLSNLQQGTKSKYYGIEPLLILNPDGRIFAQNPSRPFNAMDLATVRGLFNDRSAYKKIKVGSKEYWCKPLQITVECAFSYDATQRANNMKEKIVVLFTSRNNRAVFLVSGDSSPSSAWSVQSLARELTQEGF